MDDIIHDMTSSRLQCALILRLMQAGIPLMVDDASIALIAQLDTFGIAFTERTPMGLILLRDSVPISID